MDELSGKELSLIEILGSGNSELNQREIAKQTGFSLGMTNILLKRLINKGYVKVIGLNGRTLRYILTVRGFKEKLKRSYDFLIYSVQFLDRVKKQIEALCSVYQGTEVEIFIVGSNELGRIAQEVLREMNVKVHFGLPDRKEPSTRAVLLICEMIDGDQIPGGFEVIQLDRLMENRN